MSTVGTWEPLKERSLNLTMAADMILLVASDFHFPLLWFSRSYAWELVCADTMKTVNMPYWRTPTALCVSHSSWTVVALPRSPSHACCLGWHPQLCIRYWQSSVWQLPSLSQPQDIWDSVSGTFLMLIWRSLWTSHPPSETTEPQIYITVLVHEAHSPFVTFSQTLGL